ncbi:MAG TPA: hypothetical protein VJL88_04760 [Nitrospira sp.]|nr:hypothetical protein [Nitrospira sp.]
MRARRYLTAYLSAALVYAACSTGPELDVKIDESPQGAVYLKRIPDGSLQAAHPIKIDSGTIALLLSGILISEQQPGPKIPSARPDARRMFSDSEVGYLAPLVSEGLRRAASDQQVGFRIGQAGNTGPSSTTAVLYAYGRSLYITLTRYHSREDAATTTEMPGSTLSFVPEAAKRPDTYLDAQSTGKTLVIDYTLLDRFPAAAGVPASAPPAPAPSPPPSANADKADPAKHDSEIEALRKELQEIKKQLAEQEAERARSQQKNAAPQQ